LKARIERLLSPEPAEPLAAEAAKSVATFLPAIEARKQQARAHEEAQERASAEHAEHYAAKSTIIREQRKRIEDAIERNNAKAAVAEVIG
jgi:transcription elongation GreA/GreB family factor